MTLAWLQSDDTQAVFAMLARAGYQALAVGGCVRNALMNRAVNDIDIATDALPLRVIELAEAAGLKAIPTGIDHGTVTVVAGKTPYEITTFRRDVDTDGRHATVMFTDQIEQDASRRDFTMNALYMQADGTVIDPLGGLPDLEEGRLRFIQDAAKRIQEDYLRALRFFRFHALYANADLGFDADALAAIAGNLDGLSDLSAERVTSELIKLLAAPDPAPSIAACQSVGALNVILPGADIKPLAPLVHLEVDNPIDPMRRLAALGGDTDGLRLSKVQQKRLALFREEIGSMTPAAALGYHYGEDDAVSILLLRAAILEMPLADLSQCAFGAAQVFPVRAKDLMKTHKGRELGDALKSLEQQWIASGFKRSKKDLLT